MDVRSQRTALYVLLLATVVLLVVVIGAGALKAFARGEFNTWGTSFDLVQAQEYVDAVRADVEPLAPSGELRDLPADLAHLSVDGEVVVGGDREAGQLFVKFWTRRGMSTMSSDYYYYIEGPDSITDYYPDARDLEPIAPGWYHFVNEG